jgi:Ca2+-binding EF-hand superfamily protein
MNPERKGAIDRKKFSDFLATYNYNESISNQVFDFIDEDGSGGMDYMEFCDMFGPYLMPDWTDKDREQRPRAPSLTIPPPRQLEDRKMRKVIEDLGTSLAMRHKSAHHVFRTLDAENDGTLSKTKVREFFARQSYPKDVADRFFATFPKDSDGEISSHEFTSYFTPYIIKGYDGKGINEVPQYMSKVKIPLRPAYVKDPELRAVLPGLEEAVKSRFPDLRQAFRAIDIEKDGKLERRDIQKFLGSYGHSKTISDKFFDHLNKEDDNHIDYMEFQAYFAPVIYGYPQLGLERNTVDTLKQRAQSEGRKASVMGEGWESTLQQEAPKLRSRSSCSRSASVCESLTERSDRTRSDRTQSARGPRALRSSDSELNRVVANIGETMKARHGDCRSAFKRVATSHKDCVTRGDVQKLFRNYGYGESADQFFDRLDGDKTGAVDYTSFQKIFAKHVDQADGSQSGQSTYRSAFGG